MIGVLKIKGGTGCAAKILAVDNCQHAIIDDGALCVVHKNLFGAYSGWILWLTTLNLDTVDRNPSPPHPAPASVVPTEHCQWKSLHLDTNEEKDENGHFSVS